MWCACHLVECELGRGGFSTQLWPALCTHKRMVKSLELGKKALRNHSLEQTLWRPKRQFLNESWNQHVKLTFTLDHMKTEYLLYILLTSRQWEESLGNDSLMKSSRSLGWFVWQGAGGAGEMMEETPSTSCLVCSFWRRRSFRSSLAFRHGGRLASAPSPASQRIKRGNFNFLDTC